MSAYPFHWNPLLSGINGIVMVTNHSASHLLWNGQPIELIDSKSARKGAATSRLQGIWRLCVKNGSTEGAGTNVRYPPQHLHAFVAYLPKAVR